MASLWSAGSAGSSRASWAAAVPHDVVGRLWADTFGKTRHILTKIKIYASTCGSEIQGPVSLRESQARLARQVSDSDLGVVPAPTAPQAARQMWLKVNFDFTPST
ncbi:hypothetical protein VSDG_05322 [Cytospora chrysosperma]|uniref:Uncharacterized protein n=1 Tax=Cytospora chrysosperma TaxID=252740 RepID=A0A423VX75_CYTCH|nr:hypothetical protein VSDG_05322 [Valsa sordida]